MADLDVRALRARLGMDRPQFEAAYGVPVACLADWEQGRKQPVGVARVYLGVIAADPQGVRSARAKVPQPSASKMARPAPLLRPTAAPSPRVMIRVPRAVETPPAKPLHDRATELLARLGAKQAQSAG